MKTKVFVMNVDSEYIFKKAWDREIIYYFLDFISDNGIDSVCFPKGCEYIFKDLKIDFEININEYEINDAMFFKKFKDDMNEYDSIIMIDYAYPTLNYILNKNIFKDLIAKDGLIGLNCKNYDKKELNFFNENYINNNILFINCSLREEIFKIEDKIYLENISKINNFNGVIMEFLKGDSYFIDDLFDLNSNMNYIKTLNSLKFLINKRHIDNGVMIIDPMNTFIDFNVKIGKNTTIYSSCSIEGNSIIDDNCTIYPNSNIVNSHIEDNVKIQFSTIIDSKILKNTTIGPYAFIRPGSIIGEGVKVGCFVEIKNSEIGSNTKVPHLSYVGDAKVGQRCNIGCGSIFANYDGKNKYKTVVGNNVFIGSNSTLIAPVTIHDNTYTAAGSTINCEVPENALGIARARQVNIEDWVTKKNSR